jgi:hypothetical protein
MNDNNDPYGDSYFLLSKQDLAVNDFRESDKETKRKIIEKMLTLRHNMKYNKHLLSVYMKAKGLFDTMVEEHRNQLYYLDEIYRHINQIIRENLSSISRKPNGNKMMSELIKDKKRIGMLLKKMRNSYEQLMNIDTVIGVTIENMNEIMFMEDIDGKANKHDDDDDYSEYDEYDEEIDDKEEYDDEEEEDEEEEDEEEDEEDEDDSGEYVEDEEDDDEDDDEAEDDSGEYVEDEEDDDEDDDEAEDDRGEYVEDEEEEENGDEYVDEYNHEEEKEEEEVGDTQNDINENDADPQKSIILMY